MTVYFDPDRDQWRYDFWLLKKRRTGYCVNEDGTNARNKTEARQAQAVVRGDLLKQPKTDAAAAPRGRYTLAHALAAYVERAKRLRNWESIQDYVTELKNWFGPATPIGDVEGRVPDYIKFSRKQKIWIWRGGPKDRRTIELKRGRDGIWRDGGRDPALWKPTAKRRSDSTTNRYLATLRTVLNIAHATRDPVTKRRMLAEPPGFENLAEPTEAARPLGDANLHRALSIAPRHVSDTIVLCIDAGLRLNEALSLENDQFDPEYRGLWLDSSTKGKRAEFVPLGAAALKLVARRVKESRQAGQSRIILYRGRWGTQKPRPVKSIATSWQTILVKLGLKGRFKFHNTRADYVSYLGDQGAPPAALQGLARHRDIKTTLRYLKVSDAAKRGAVALLDGRRAMAGLDLGGVPLVHKAGTKAAPGPTQKSHTAKRQNTPMRRKAAS